MIVLTGAARDDAPTRGAQVDEVVAGAELVVRGRLDVASVGAVRDALHRAVDLGSDSRKNTARVHDATVPHELVQVRTLLAEIAERTRHVERILLD